LLMRQQSAAQPVHLRNDVLLAAAHAVAEDLAEGPDAPEGVVEALSLRRRGRRG